MIVSALDWAIVAGLIIVILIVGLYVSRGASSDSQAYFLSGKKMPWWLLGMSMVATTFSTDTPNLVTNFVRTGGVASNWQWWVFLLTGMLTVFVYARLWRKSDVNTDLEFYELRYSGRPAHFLRSFRAIYLGIIFNVLAMSGVTIAAIKIGQVMLGLSPLEVIGIASLVTLIFSVIGGFKGVVYTDFILFFTAMAGAIAAAYYCVNLPEIGSVQALIKHPNVVDKISILPDFNNKELLINLFIIPLAVQWWSTWYPGAEPGGGGYIAQRMLAAKDQDNAIGATFLFNVMHYAIRPWPWILVALCSLVYYPDVASIQAAFPNISADKLGEDLGYSAMLTKLPTGLIGLILASLIAAYMSTISTHLNWGASYIVNDFYKSTVNPNASESTLVLVGRIATVILMVFSAGISLLFTDALQLFDFIIAFGAGTGLIFLLRWFWWRINAWSEISAMLISGVVSIFFNLTDAGRSMFGLDGLPTWSKLPLIVGITTLVWVIVTYMTKPEDEATLISFYNKTQPGGPGWSKVKSAALAKNIPLIEAPWQVPQGIIAMLYSLFLVYGLMFFTGNLLYGNYRAAIIALCAAFLGGIGIYRIWPKIRQLVVK